MTVTFSRIRPVESVNPIGAATRRREGTLALELESPRQFDVDTAAENGLLVVSRSLTDVDAAAWVVDPEAAVTAHDKPGWRLTVVDSGDGEAVLDAVARTRAAFVRTGRSAVEALAVRMSRPGLTTTISVFVDDVEQALSAVAAGAGDLLLRDWDAERIGQLRDALGERGLVERTVFGAVTVDAARAELSESLFSAWLRQVDSSGWARPRVDWAPGADKQAPILAQRISAAWSDEAWASGRAPTGLAGAGPLLPILEASLEGTPPDVFGLEALLGARGDQVDAVAWTADRLRARTVGDEATYVVNRNINYTNLCYFRCGFCAFSKGPRSLNLRGDPYLMGIDEIVGHAVEAWDRGATEVTLQGGIHPDFTGDFYAEVIEAIKAVLPQMHIHGFTPLEVWQGAATLGVTVRNFLTRLRDAGLGTLPGTAAEILDDRVREHLCPDKIRTAQWADVMITAHELGLRATATIMFGHIDDPGSWAR
ncbi:MAG: radical SAM protein, partial [Acidimicrobiia bacterium]|nr:radical SAM protein [Acidimicrobiia bacterium]